MPKKIPIIIVLFLFLAVNSAGAAPTYGTDMPGRGRYATGYQSNIVFKHDLNDSNGNIKSDQHFYDLSYGVYDWLTVDGKIGFGDLRRKGGIHPKVDYNYGFAGGYGFRIKVWKNEKYKARGVLAFHHISVHPQARTLNNDGYKSIYDDWQTSLLGSKEIGPINPFIGLKLSLGDYIYWVNDIDRKRKTSDCFVGLVVGTSVKLNKEVYVRIEGHLFDETALSTGIYYTF